MDSKKPMLNVGCGKVILPGAKPPHHEPFPDELYTYPNWVNVDRVDYPGVERMDVFKYPWAYPDNHFSGALLSHIVEHIPHVPKVRRPNPGGAWELEQYRAVDARAAALERLDGFYAFFAELHRVLEPGATAHVLVPHAWSQGAMQDPTHHRYLVPESFTYLVPNPNAPFELEALGAWEMGEVMYNLTAYGHELQQVSYMEAQTQAQKVAEQNRGLVMVGNGAGNDPAMVNQIASERFTRKLATMLNVAHEFYVPLKVIK